MSNQAGPSNIPQASLLELKALTAQHTDRFVREGKASVRAQARGKAVDKLRDPFSRPSPGLVKRLATEARNDVKHRVFQDDSGPSDEQRHSNMIAKARKYDRMRRGDLSGLSEKELSESVLDFERQWEDGWSDHSSDLDESAFALRGEDGSNAIGLEDDLAIVEYIDEMGRTRTGTSQEAKDAQRQRAAHKAVKETTVRDTSAYAEVQRSQVIHGDQNFFPIFEPDQDELRAKYKAAQQESRMHHYDATKEVRTRAAGQYQFSLDEDERAAQRASLDEQRAATQRARGHAEERVGMSTAQQGRKRKENERRAMIEAKRARMAGGSDALEQLRSAGRAKAAQNLLEAVESELLESGSVNTQHQPQ